jgi:copper(I)-binding protein
MKLHITFLLNALLLICIAFSQTLHADSLQILHARVNPTIPNMTVSSAYFDIVNRHEEAIRLDSVSSNISTHVEIHEHTMQGGLMTMKEVANGVSILAGETLSFQPGGYHLMIMNLQSTIKEGDLIELTFHFSDQSRKTVLAKAIRPTY